jgi:hypothetical protein
MFLDIPVMPVAESGRRASTRCARRRKSRSRRDLREECGARGNPFTGFAAPARARNSVRHFEKRRHVQCCRRGAAALPRRVNHEPSFTNPCLHVASLGRDARDPSLAAGLLSLGSGTHASPEHATNAMETPDYYNDRKFCSHCNQYVAYLMSIEHSYCVECGKEVRLFSQQDWSSFHQQMEERKPKGGRPRKSGIQGSGIQNGGMQPPKKETA